MSAFGESVADLAQAVEVVDVDSQCGNSGHRDVRMRSDDRDARRESRAASRRFSAYRRSSAAVSWCPGTPSRRSAPPDAWCSPSFVSPSGWTRLSTSPANGMASASSRSAKYEASRKASGSGVATMMKAVSGCLSSA